MAPSRHRLTLSERRAPVADVEPLADLEAAYIDHHKSLGRSENTWKRHQATHKLFRKFLISTSLPDDSSSLTTATMRLFSRWLQDTPTERPQRGTTVRSVYGTRASMKDMRALTFWLFEEGRLDQLPKTPMPKLPDTMFPILADDKLDQVWNSKYLTGRSSMAIRNRAIIGLMLDTGLRRAEVASLSIASLDLPNCLLTVIGKGQKERRVPFSSSVKILLDEWIAVRGREDGALFWLKPAGIRSLFRVIKDDVGLERFHPHLLRHQAATALVRNHADVESVRRILGHSDISTTIKYLSMSDEDIRAKHQAASPFDSLIRRSAETAPKRKRLSLKAS